MNHVRLIKTVVLVIAAVAVVGCKSKQEAPAQGAPQQSETVKSVSGQNTAGAIASSPQDKSDAEAAATRVLAQMESGDFSTIYRNAAPTFQQIGKEEAFVAKFQQTRQTVGPLGKPQEASFVTAPDRSYILVYHLENDRFKTERRLTFARSKSGKMELFGMNQHDESKAVPRK